MKCRERPAQSKRPNWQASQTLPRRNTKAFVLFLSQGLNVELAPKGVYVQAVLPAAIRTEIWERAGVHVSTLPEVRAAIERLRSPDYTVDRTGQAGLGVIVAGLLADA